MLILRIRHAETAIADGRLDEAFELVRSDAKLRSHRRGQAIVTKLAKAFHERGREHLKQNRGAAALTDCEKGQQIGGDLPELISLRSEAMDAINTQRRDQRLKTNAVAAAREQIDNGRLAAGEKLLAVASVHDTRAGQLLAELGARHDVVDSAIRGATDALDRDDLDAAVIELERARVADRSDKRLKELSDRVKRTLRSEIQSAIEEGRLDVADGLSGRLSRIDGEGFESERLLGAVSQCRTAWERIERGQVREAEEICRRLTSIFPKAKWLNASLEHLTTASAAIGSLRTGPLGLLATTRMTEMPTQMPPPTPERGTGFQPVRETRVETHGLKTRATENGLPSKFILQVDGAGSVLVVRQNVVTIGPISSSQTPDVALIAEPSAPVITIERADEDYFVRGQVYAINDKPSRDKLLASGDKVSLTPRCRIGFSLPSAASTSAAIDLVGARFPRADVRRVVLMDRDIVIGPGAGSHVRCDQTPEPIVLHVRDNRLFCKSSGNVEVDGKPMDRNEGLPVGAHVRVGLVSFVVTKA